MTPKLTIKECLKHLVKAEDEKKFKKEVMKYLCDKERCDNSGLENLGGEEIAKYSRLLTADGPLADQYWCDPQTAVWKHERSKRDTERYLTEVIKLWVGNQPKTPKKKSNDSPSKSKGVDKYFNSVRNQPERSARKSPSEWKSFPIEVLQATSDDPFAPNLSPGGAQDITSSDTAGVNTDNFEGDLDACRLTRPGNDVRSIEGSTSDHVAGDARLESVVDTTGCTSSETSRLLFPLAGDRVSFPSTPVSVKKRPTDPSHDNLTTPSTSLQKRRRLDDASTNDRPTATDKGKAKAFSYGQPPLSISKSSRYPASEYWSEDSDAVDDRTPKANAPPRSSPVLVDTEHVDFHDITFDTPSATPINSLRNSVSHSLRARSVNDEDIQHGPLSTSSDLLPTRTLASLTPAATAPEAVHLPNISSTSDTKSDRKTTITTMIMNYIRQCEIHYLSRASDPTTSADKVTSHRVRSALLHDLYADLESRIRAAEISIDGGEGKGGAGDRVDGAGISSYCLW